MRLDLGSFSGVDAELRLPVEDDGAPKHLSLRKLAALTGVLERRDGAHRLSDVRAGEVHLGAARWTFGSVELVSPEPCELLQMGLDLEISEGPLHLDLEAHQVNFARLEILVDDIRVSGMARLQDARLQLHEGVGRVRAEVAHLTDLEVDLGTLALRAPELTVEGFVVGWGQPDGFLLAARKAVGERVVARAAGLSATADQADMRGFEVRRGDVHVLSFDAANLQAEVEMTGSDSAKEGERPPSTAAARPVFDLDTLDALEGELVADGRFELRLPAGLRRKLQIPLRLAVVEGSIDYRALESCLPTFEDSLLDFSRDGDWLALELGLPLLPTRGLGKQLLRWPLRSSDGTTRQGHQVRLAVLPQFQRPASRKSSAPPQRESTPGKSAVRLDRAAVKIGPMKLSMPPPSQHLNAALELLTFEKGELSGQLEHVHDQVCPGELRAQFGGLEARLDGLSAGSRQLDLNLLAAHADVRTTWRGFRPVGLKVAVEKPELGAIKYVARG